MFKRVKHIRLYVMKKITLCPVWYGHSLIFHFLVLFEEGKMCVCTRMHVHAFACFHPSILLNLLTAEQFSMLLLQFYAIGSHLMAVLF